MRLTDLEPQFLRLESPRYRRYVDSLAEAQGIMFLCPKCFVQNRGPVGTHRVLCWFYGYGVPDEETPGPGRWVPVGAGLGDLTLEARPEKTRSILIGGPCCWHGYITRGEVTDA